MTAGRFLLTAALAGLLGTALFISRPVAPGPEEATLLLEAASLAHDRDLAYGDADIARFRARGWAPNTRAAVEFDTEGRHRFGRPLSYPLVLAPFEAALPGRGALVANVLLLALAAALAVRQLEPRIGAAASWLVLVGVFGSAVFGYTLAARPETFLIAATVGALALCWPRVEEFLPITDFAAPEMNPKALGGAGSDSPPRPTVGAIGRWLAAGALLGAVVLYHPFFALLALPLVGGIPRRLRRVAIPTVLVGLLVALGGSWLTGTLWTEFVFSPKLVIAADGLADLGARGTSPAAGLDHKPVWPPPMTDYGLHVSNLTYLAGGQHLGSLVYFLPLLLFLWLGRGAAAQGRLLVVTAIIVIGLLALFPFDLAGGGGPGSRWLVPLYAAFWLTPAHRPGAVSLAFFGLVGVLAMLPLWGARPPASGGVTAPAFARLPFETTQRGVPVAAEIVRRGARVRAASADISAGRAGGTMVLSPGGRAQLVVVADRAVAVVAVELGAQARGELELRGGTIEHEVFRPDGGVTYRIRPRGPRRHGVWWSDERQYVYRLGFSVPETTVALPFGVSVE